MGKKGDPKVPILPSTTRKGTVLSTSVALDSPSVMSKFASPPPHAASTESVTMSDTFDDASTILDDTGSLGPFLESQITKAAKQTGVEISFVTRYPFGRSSDYPDLSKFKDKCFEDDYIELDDEFIKDYADCNNSADPDAIKKLLEKHAMKNKFVPDPEFATSPISIKDANFDFSVDLSLRSMVEADPFYGRENDEAIIHLSKLTELSGLFSNIEKIRNYHVVNLFPFSLKEGAKAWYDRLPYGSVKSP